MLLNFLYVDAGQTSFGQGAVLGAGAYMAAVLTGLHGVPYPGWPPWSAFVAAMAVGLLCALPALRVQQYYLGFVTFGVALVFPEMIAAFPQLHRRHQRHPHSVSRTFADVAWAASRCSP